ncbi:MAG: helix-turn-helix domain-containing protein [Mycoplasmatota bacterium]
MKLKLQDKLEIIEMYTQGFSIAKIRLKYNVGKTVITEITRQYRTHGIESFTEKFKNRKYTIGFKIEIVSRVLNGEAKNSISNELMINIGLIHSWLKKYDELGYNGLKEKIKGRPKNMSNENKQTNKLELNDTDKRIKELEERNAQLEMENDLLKKLRALVQQREQPQNKKK